MISASNQHIGYTMAYDTLGRLAVISDSNQRTIRYQYDALGNRVKMTTPEGKVVQYSYDEANRLVGMDSFLIQLNTVPGAQPGFAPNIRPYQPSPPR